MPKGGAGLPARSSLKVTPAGCPLSHRLWGRQGGAVKHRLRTGWNAAVLQGTDRDGSNVYFHDLWAHIDVQLYFHSFIAL